MITHTIAPYKAAVPLAYKHGNYGVSKKQIGSERHKRLIHRNSVNACKFNEGDWVLFKDEACQILTICEKFHDAQWDNLKCLYIELWDGVDMVYAHHTDLRKL